MLENVIEVWNNGTIVLMPENQTQLFVFHWLVGLGSRKRLIWPDSCFVIFGVVARKVFANKIPTKVTHLLFLLFSLIFTIINKSSTFPVFVIVWTLFGTCKVELLLICQTLQGSMTWTSTEPKLDSIDLCYTWKSSEHLDLDLSLTIWGKQISRPLFYFQ